ncbi:MAG: hypothetical protein RIM99_10565 [Cyclobacteriaceae bacterium]
MQIKILSLHCTLNDEVDKDEVFLKYEGKKIWPTAPYKSINSGEKKEIGKEFTHKADHDMVLELWDFDFLSKNDLLGTFTMKVDEEDRASTYFTTMKVAREGSTASYMLEWEIIKRVV